MVPPGTKQQIQIVHETLVTSTGRVWRYLLDNGKELAERHGVRPEDLILGGSAQTARRDSGIPGCSRSDAVTKTGLDLRLYVQDLREAHHRAFPNHGHMPMHHQSAFPSQHGHGFSNFGFSGHHQHHQHGFMSAFPPDPPAVFYLFTAQRQDHELYWSETPFYAPLPKGKKPPEMKARCWTGLEWLVHFYACR